MTCYALLAAVLGSISWQNAEGAWFVATMPDFESIDLTAVDSFDGRHGLAAGTYGTILATSNGGLTWSRRPTTARESFSSALMLDQQTGLTSRTSIYVGTLQRGAWLPSLRPAATDDTFFSLSRCGGGAVCTVRGGSIYRSVDKGREFSEVHVTESGLPFRRLVFPSAAVGFAFGGQSSEAGSVSITATSSDGGAHWKELESHLPELLAVSFFNDLHGLAITAARDLIETREGAITWGAVVTDLPALYPFDLKCRGSAECWLTTLYGEIYSTRNAGNVWHLDYADAEERAITAVSSDGRIAVGNGGLVLINDQINADGFEN